MARYTGPSCRLCRREGVKLYLKGDRCYTPKCAIERRKSLPGMHGMIRKKLTQYAIQLREKQKLKRIYGLTEKQFRLTFARAEKMKGIVGENFLSILERRLDNVIYRLGIGVSRKQARQLVSHGHVTVNGRKVDIPSFVLRTGDQIALKDQSKQIIFVKEGMEKSTAVAVPSWLELNPESIQAKVARIPGHEDFADVQVDEKLVVEFYSR